jgi:hypothetical protein
MLANGHLSFYGERGFGSACVGAQTARLQGVVYKYHLLWLHCGSCLFYTVGGSHNSLFSQFLLNSEEIKERIRLTYQIKLQWMSL